MNSGVIVAIVIVSIVVTVVPAVWIMIKVFGGLAKGQADTKRLLQTGIPAKARVLGVQMGGMTVTMGVHRHLQLILSLEVQPQGQPPYQTQMTAMVSELQIPQIQPNTYVQIRIDPADPSKMALEATGVAPGPIAGAPGQQPGMPGAAPGWGQQAGAPGAAPGYGQQPGMPGAPGQPAPGYGAQPGMPGAAPGFAQPGAPGAPMGGPMGGTPVAPMTAPAGARIGMMIGIGSAVLGVGIAIAVAVGTMRGEAGWDGGTDVEDDSSSSKSDDDSSSSKSDDDSSSGASDICRKAAKCCEVISGQAGTAANCKNMLKSGMPESGCKTAYDGYKRAAKAMKKECD
jgi:hypothetical protein